MFDKQKKDILNKLDKSKKGEIDQPIKPILDIINSHNDFFTTSSCSGRIIVLEIPEEGKKNQAKWLYVSHEKTDLEKIQQSLKDISNDVWLNQEPAIFHIVCRNIESSKKILDTARNAGLKRSGLTTLGDKLLCQIASTDVLATIIAKNGQIVVSEEYLALLIQEANKKMQKNQERLELFITGLRQIL